MNTSSQSALTGESSTGESSVANEQAQVLIQPPAVITQPEMSVLQSLSTGLLAALEQYPDGDLIAEIVTNSLKLLRDETNRGDIKIVNRAVKELRYALKVFAPYHETRKVSIFGSARTPHDHADYIQATAFGREMAQRGWMVITGAGGGIMAAGHGGAGAEPSFGLAISLPFEQHTNPHIAGDPKLIHFKYFFTRKLMFVRASHAIVLLPGGFGTLDEGYEVLTLIQTGKATPKPIVFLDPPGGDFWVNWKCYVEEQLLKRGFISPEDMRLFLVTDSLEAAIEETTRFYRNFHSVRYTRDELILRLQHRPSTAQLNQIKELFSDILTRGTFRLSEPLPIESNEPSLAHLPRLVFAFNRRDHGRLRILIDHLNDLVR
jgi:uncharacterized protein (TIGR00730 family)